MLHAAPGNAVMLCEYVTRARRRLPWRRCSRPRITTYRLWMKMIYGKQNDEHACWWLIWLSTSPLEIQRPALLASHCSLLQQKSDIRRVWSLHQPGKEVLNSWSVSAGRSRSVLLLDFITEWGGAEECQSGWMEDCFSDRRVTSN
jgi:hypothetical protein